MRRFLGATLRARAYQVVEAARPGRHSPRRRDATRTSSCSIWVCPTATGWRSPGRSAARHVRRSSCSRRAGQEQDKVAALDLGADDYLTKPFGVHELLARIRVALRHASTPPGSTVPVFESGELRVDLERRLVFRGGGEIHLTPTEYKLLAVLVRHAGKVLTHRQLLHEVWGANYDGQTQYLRVYMAQLRQKLERDSTRPRLLLTEPGVGYRLLMPA